MFRDSMQRRRFLGVSATALAAGVAGCLGGSAYDTNDESSDSSDEDSNADSGSDSDSESETSGGSNSSEFGGWFDNVSNFDGVVDKTGESEVTVKVGAEGNSGGFAFDPAAIAVDAGTTVVWEWTGNGGMHNVVDDDGSFESEMTDEAGRTFSHTFDTAGTFKYKCAPHESMGMKGAVVVE